MDYGRLKRALGLLLFCMMISLSVRTERSVLRSGDESEDEYVDGSNIDVAEKVAFLTFDDGPSKNTEKVLDILDEYNIKASFFVIGSEATDEYREELNRMVSSGHCVGLHCRIHDYKKLYSSDGNCVSEILAEKQYLKNSFGIDTDICRLPGGSYNKYINNRKALLSGLRQEGLQVFDWNVSGEDSIGRPGQYTITRNVLGQLKDKKYVLILLHDGIINDETVRALPEIIDGLLEKGYGFKTLNDEMSMVFTL